MWVDVVFKIAKTMAENSPEPQPYPYCSVIVSMGVVREWTRSAIRGSRCRRSVTRSSLRMRWHRHVHFQFLVENAAEIQTEIQSHCDCKILLPTETVWNPARTAIAEIQTELHSKLGPNMLRLSSLGAGTPMFATESWPLKRWETRS